MFDLFRKELTVTRFEESVLNDNGIFEHAAAEIFTIKASVQPTPAEEMLVLSEGYRTKDSFTLFTETELKTSSRNYLPDLVVISGVKYEVIKVAEWQNKLIPHYKCIVTRVDSDNVN